MKPDGIDEQLKLALERCERIALALTGELTPLKAKPAAGERELELEWALDRQRERGRFDRVGRHDMQRNGHLEHN
jgi:hypothetical protein